MAKINDKIMQIIQYLKELSEIAPSDIEEYKSIGNNINNQIK